MRKIRKIPLFAFILALMLSTGSACIFPMFTAEASSDVMHMDHQSASSEQGEAIEGNDTDAIVHIPYSENHVKTCSTECGQSVTDTAAIKKVKETSGLPILHVSTAYISPSDDGTDFDAFEPPEILPLQEAILTVAKKE